MKMKMSSNTSTCYKITDLKIDITYSNMTEHDVRLYLVRWGSAEYNEAMKMSMDEVEELLIGSNHLLEIQDREWVKVNNNNNKEVSPNWITECYFFDLTEKSVDELLDSYNMYMALYETFKDIDYKKVTYNILQALRFKQNEEEEEEVEVNVS